VCVCVRACVCVWERESQREKERIVVWQCVSAHVLCVCVWEREREREGERDRETVRESIVVQIVWPLASYGHVWESNRKKETERKHHCTAVHAHMCKELLQLLKCQLNTQCTTYKTIKLCFEKLYHVKRGTWSRGCALLWIYGGSFVDL